MTRDQVHQAFEAARRPDDHFRETGAEYDALTETREILKAVGRVDFKVDTTIIIGIVVYEDGTFTVPTCACASSLPAIDAYARARQFITALALVEKS